MPDGKFILTNGVTYNVSVVRYKQNGQIDSSYANNGCTASTPFAYLDCSALQPDNKLLISGSYDSIDGYSYTKLVRYTVNGEPDSTFGKDGFIYTSNGSPHSFVRGMAVMPDGRIVVGGIGYNPQGYSAAMLKRYMSDGSLDTTLNHTGLSYPFRADYCRAAIWQPDGRALLSIGGVLTDTYICRMKDDGSSVDSSYGQNGFAHVPCERITSMIYLPDGRLLCGGYDTDFVLIRLLPNGLGLDSTFGKNGVVRTDVYGNNDVLSMIQLQQDNKILVAGESNGLTILRYNQDAQVVAVIQRIGPKIDVYPNPVKNIITIDFGQLPTANCIYTITNIDGRLLASCAIHTSRENVDVSYLPQGTYIISVSSPFFSQSRLFTKQ